MSAEAHYIKATTTIPRAPARTTREASRAEPASSVSPSVAVGSSPEPVVLTLGEVVEEDDGDGVGVWIVVELV